MSIKTGAMAAAEMAKVAEVAKVGFFRRQTTKFVEYSKQVGADYATVARETVTGCKEKPLKAAFYFTALGGLGYACATNPSYEDMMNELREKRQTMVLIPNSEHNPNTDKELAYRSLLLNQHRLHYYNFWFVSLLVRSTHDDKVRLFASQDSIMKAWPWEEFYNNILDVGFMGKWYRLEQKFTDFDLNTAELDQLPA